MADRTARLMRIIDLLQARGPMTATALAAHLGVSERTVRRDLIRLHDLDLPLEVRPGRGGGVTLPANALLAPLRFTDAEVIALRLGARTVASARDTGLARAANSALTRLEQVMTPRARDRARALAAALADAPPRGDDPCDGESPIDTETVLQVAEAVARRRCVTLRYVSPSSGETTRTVDPYGLVRLGHWYLAAHCHLRNALRTFRLDRIRRLTPEERTFAPPVEFDAFAMVATSLALAPLPGTVVCRVWLDVDLETARRTLTPRDAVLEPQADGVLVSSRFPRDHLDRLALDVLGLPWPAVVQEPPELRAALRRLADRANALARG